ncbi:hypothetical protein ATCCBAA256_14930 [Mycobacterium montefiorense]|uniref:hypothetical protein n=1 Tax=Mycobacterium montefiorense TaxID=154654 RepID=UPI0021DCED1B|nr:hypothetical protein [Mycobacterium montefiorense]GLE51917.1 hypothetical protein ATCCBAA256_14930 [Mycobacterium montefiorense]
MNMPTTDYNQQLLCYLQNWRQLLEQWAAMAAGSPFLTGPPVLPTAPAGGQFIPPMGPFMQFLPPMPVMPPIPSTPMGPPTPTVSPAPGDYAQQLFSHLQAWRQYLEQATGAVPAPTQATTAPANDGGKTGAQPWSDVPIPPDDEYASKGIPKSADGTGSNSTWPPKLVSRAPSKYHQSQLTAVGTEPAATPFDGPNVDILREPFQMADPTTLAARPDASRPISEAIARPEVGSAFVRTMNSVDHTTLPQATPRSLFSTPGAPESFR